MSIEKELKVSHCLRIFGDVQGSLRNNQMRRRKVVLYRATHRTLRQLMAINITKHTVNRSTLRSEIPFLVTFAAGRRVEPILAKQVKSSNIHFFLQSLTSYIIFFIIILGNRLPRLSFGVFRMWQRVVWK